MADLEPTTFETSATLSTTQCESKYSHSRVDAAECPECGEFELIRCGRCATCHCCGFSLCSR